MFYRLAKLIISALAIQATITLARTAEENTTTSLITAAGAIKAPTEPPTALTFATFEEAHKGTIFIETDIEKAYKHELSTVYKKLKDLDIPGESATNKFNEYATKQKGAYTTPEQIKTFKELANEMTKHKKSQEKILDELRKVEEKYTGKIHPARLVQIRQAVFSKAPSPPANSM